MKVKEKMTPEELKEIKERAEKATPGPWDVYNFGVYSMTKINMLTSEPFNLCSDVPWNDAEFIAHARTDIPKLLDEIERLKFELSNINKDDLTFSPLYSRYTKLEKENARLREEVEMLRYLHTEEVNVRTKRQLELHEQDKEIARLREALKFYAGMAKDACWEGPTLLTFDKCGGLCEEISGPYVARKALGEGEK